jgi:hypothetical protein
MRRTWGRARIQGYLEDMLAAAAPILNAGSCSDPTAFELAPGVKNFIQPGVTQWYRKPLVLPAGTSLIHVWAAFEYRIELGKISQLLARLLPEASREVRGKDHIDYTVRRSFAIES